MKTIKLDLALFHRAPLANLSVTGHLLWLTMAAYCNTYRTRAVARGFVACVDTEQDIDDLIAQGLAHAVADAYVLRELP